jgi:hypothetical protein
MSMEKVFYIGTKKYDINIFISCRKSNYIGYEIEKRNHEICFHFYKLHIRISRYGIEKYNWRN